MKYFISLLVCILLVLPASAKIYDFSDEATQEYAQTSRYVNIPRGQIIYSRLNSDITSENNSKGDVIITQLVKDWVYMGRVIAPEGSLISGRITNIENSSYALGNAKVNITFNQITRPDNVVINFQSKPICVTIGDSRFKSSMKLMGQGVLKSVSTSRSMSNMADRTVNGAIAGGFTFLTSKGEEVNIPFGTEFKINIIGNITTIDYEN